MTSIKLGFIGSNFVSDWLADAVDLTTGFTKRAIYSRTLEKGNDFASRHNIETVYTDIDEFLSSDIDAVYIASPNFAHYSQALMALDYGKHILCEKPTASNLREFSDMSARAVEKGLVLLEAMRPAYDSALNAVKSSLDKIGKIRRVSFEFCQYSSRYDKFKNGTILPAFDSSLSNAAVMDIGVYPIHFCIRLFGKPNEILSSSIIMSNGFEGAGEVIFKYDDMNAVISYSKIHDSALPSVISGELGSITIDKMSKPCEIKLIMRDGVTENINFDYKENNMVFELNEFYNLIKNGSYGHIHTEYSRMEAEIIDEIRKQNGIVFPADHQ